MSTLSTLPAACTSEAGTSPARLELVEATAASMPAGGVISGIAALDSATLAAWSGGRLYALSGTGHPLLVTENAGQPVGLRFAPGGGLEVVDAKEGSTVSYSAQGRRVQTRSLGLSLKPTGAVALGDTWIIGGADSLRYDLVAVAADGSVRLLHRRAADASTTIAPALHLTQAGDDLLLTDLEPPYTIRRLDRQGRVLRTFAPGAASLPLPGRDSTAVQDRWVSLPAVWFGDGYLQTLADLTSDRRVFVAYDAEGRQRSASLVDAPIGITAATPDLRHVIGSRGATVPEIVLYRWRWSPH